MNTNIWGDFQICSSVPLKEMWKSKWFAGMAERAKLQWQKFRFIKGNIVRQASFYAHFVDDKHHGMNNLKVTITDQTDISDDLRRRESFWEYKLDTFQPNRLTERDMVLFWSVA